MILKLSDNSKSCVKCIYSCDISECYGSCQTIYIMCKFYKGQIHLKAIFCISIIYTYLIHFVVIPTNHLHLVSTVSLQLQYVVLYVTSYNFSHRAPTFLFINHLLYYGQLQYCHLHQHLVYLLYYLAQLVVFLFLLFLCLSLEALFLHFRCKGCS